MARWLKSYELKLSRGQHHLKELKRVWRVWVKATNQTVVEGPDANHPGAYGTWVTAPDLPSDYLSLLVGDTLQCFRTALDHIAFELASTFTSPLSDDLAKLSEFPIFDDANGTGSARFHQRRNKGPATGDPARGSGLSKIAGMDPAAQTIIESLQPYHRGNAYTDDPLWKLHELNRLDKHRVLHLVAANLTGTMLQPSKTVNVAQLEGPGQIQSLGGAVEGRTQIIRMTLRPVPIDPQKKMRVNFLPALAIVFDAGIPLVGGANVIEVLDEIDNYVVSDVVPPLRPFLK